MKTPRSKYQLHAELHRRGVAAMEFDDAHAGYPLARRLNRIERVAAAYRGSIEQSFDNGLLITFASADAALLGACEMQQRCSGLPQASGQRLALRIGIHQGALRQRAQDEVDGTEETAAKLAVVDEGIVASDAVVAELNHDLRLLASRFADSPIERATYQVNWHSEIPATAYGGEAMWPTANGARASGPHLILHQGLKTLQLTQDGPLITVGRAPSNDLVVNEIFVSRKHCRIERQADCIVLTDWSTNGTCIMPDQGGQRLIKNDSIHLEGKGLLFFGRLCNGERRGGVRFETS
ncbi:MAG: Forkhead-associated [Proteobacteria bacterium]|nr:Forkhead-associated [Pseudomonadota bacterium]